MKINSTRPKSKVKKTVAPDSDDMMNGKMDEYIL